MTTTSPEDTVGCIDPDVINTGVMPTTTGISAHASRVPTNHR